MSWYLSLKVKSGPKARFSLNIICMKKQLRFKTNINCNNCIRTVSGFLNDVKEIEKWEVDIANPDKILTVEGENITFELVKEAVEEAGFDIKGVEEVKN